MNSKPVWKIEKIVLPQDADHAGVMWHGKYFNWNNMSKEQKLNFKRACLFPFLVYVVYIFLNQYSLAILLLLGLYFLIRFKNRNKLGR